MSASKSKEEREFYMLLTIKDKLSHRELVRQIDSGYYERYILSSNIITWIHDSDDNTEYVFMDKYALEFLDTPRIGSEKDLQKLIIKNLKHFILEIGRDFTFVGEEYRIQVGNHDLYIDLLFYHRDCLVWSHLNLKLVNLNRKFIGKINLYLEALDMEVKKSNENPSVGILLCASKDDEVVEFALSRSLSPTLVSEYTLNLIDKKLLQKKLREYTKIAEEGNE